MTHCTVQWGASTVELCWNAEETLPPLELITSVHGFCFDEAGRFMLVDLKHRGWDFPGGHLEHGETPEAAFRREALEEGYVEGDLQLLGSVTVDHGANPAWSEDSPYPKVGYQVFYAMRITNVLPFDAEFESASRTFVEPGAVPDYYPNWHPVYEAIMGAALVKLQT
ncbi:NUDIX hydrolase [Paenibacillus sp. NPDC058174]|uniref:NUDIX hydrolase n=1 Tax=Paenibacillus sp. NPDC058174 TaxID=3346366 RepID=UPI0036D786F2